MAKIAEQIAVLKVSKLVKDDADDSLDAITEIKDQMLEVLEELLGDGVVVELEVGND